MGGQDDGGLVITGREGLHWVWLIHLCPALLCGSNIHINQGGFYLRPDSRTINYLKFLVNYCESIGCISLLLSISVEAHQISLGRTRSPTAAFALVDKAHE